GWEHTTVADLLSHRSGLSTRAGLDFWGPLASTATLSAEVARLRTVPLAHPSGEFYEYSNANYSLLGAVVERITGTSYADALHDLVIAPLGLTTTTADPSPQEGIAATYYPWFQQASVVTPAPAVSEVGVPSAYVASSAHDLTRLLQAHLGAPSGIESRVLAASREPLGTVDEYSRYASGWIVRPMWELADADEGWDDPNRPLLWEHQGDALRAQSSLAFSPELGMGVVAVTNTGPGTDQAAWSRFLYELNHLVVGTAPRPWDGDPLVRAVPALCVGLPLLQLATLGWLASARGRPRHRWIPWTIGGLLTTAALVLGLVVVPERTEQSLLDLIWMVAVPDLAVSLGVMLLGAVCYLALAARRLVRLAGSR
ncbi:MAG: beta-lactamase family protein, partial [Propionibacteriaceae bacterium]|nr:beta-lactamase family protein [Propionibacteriaceae bacterium]